MTKQFLYLLAAATLACTANAQQQTGKYEHVDIPIWTATSATQCTSLTPNIQWAPAAVQPICRTRVPTSGGAPFSGLVIPKKQVPQVTAKSFVVQGITIPDNVDPNRPVFVRVRWTKKSDPTLSANAPSGCAAEPNACTMLSLAVWHKAELSNLNTLTQGPKCYSDLMASQNATPATDFEATSTFRGCVPITNGRMPIAIEFSRPNFRPASQGGPEVVPNNLYEIWLMHLGISWPMLTDIQIAERDSAATATPTTDSFEHVN